MKNQQEPELRDDTFAAHLWRANSHFRKDDYDHAIAAFNVIKLKPHAIDSYDQRGKAYFRKGDYYRFLADYDAFIRRTPGSVEAYSDRGNVYLE